MRTPRLSAKLDDLPATLQLVARLDLTALTTALRRGSGRPALAIGSGGAAVAAEYLARCRDSLGLGPNAVVTPMQAVAEHHSLATSQTWLFSASGDNPDACAAAQAAIDRGCTDLNLVTRNLDGVAAGIVHRHRGSVHAVPVADVKDGYLATHSLLAMTVALLLASGMAAADAMSSATMLDRIASRLAETRDATRRRILAEQWAGLRPSDILVIAADPLLRPVATLLDTSLWEATLCPVQTTDFRNLAHGRHAWFHHHMDDTMLLALAGDESRESWEMINAALPSGLRRLTTDHGRCGRLECLLGLIDGLMLIEAIGESIGVDPGKPGIGVFGRDIYNDRSLERRASELPARVRHKRAAIARADVGGTGEISLAAIGRERLRALGEANVGGAVFDYDGTIVGTDDRYELPSQAIVDELVRLHRAGVRLGIATGRGGSAGEDLRKMLPRDTLSSIVIGYYNGGYLRTADIDITLDPPPEHPAIAAMAAWLDAQDELFVERRFRTGRLQIAIDMDRLRHPYRFALDLAACPLVASGEVRVSASGHSYDIVPSASSKTAVVEAVRDAAKAGSAILCFGDSGAASGNDHAILAHPHGISVGDVCGAPDGCWSLFGGETVGPEALLSILRALVASPAGEIRFDMAALPLDSR